MFVFVVIGVWFYKYLGQFEDLLFIFKVMVVCMLWFGVIVEQVLCQVIELIEKVLMNIGEYEFIWLYLCLGELQVIFMVCDSLCFKQILDLWYQVCKCVGDVCVMLLQEIVGLFYNDEFGDIFGNIYVLMGEGFDYVVMCDYVDCIQLELQWVLDVGKVDLVGLQDEKVWIELFNIKLVMLGVLLQQVQQVFVDQNVVIGISFFEILIDCVQLCVIGQFNSIEDICQFLIQVGDCMLYLGDIVEVKCGFVDLVLFKMCFMGEDVIGLVVVMKDGGDIFKFGGMFDVEFECLQKMLLVGMQLCKVFDQLYVVEELVGEFVQVFIEVVVIVLLVSFFLLGLCIGLVVGVIILLVLVMIFFVMYYFGIGLYKILFGVLVLVLGLLVDDVIIVVEMMVIKMEQGYDCLCVVSFVWELIVFLMLIGMLIIVVGFLLIVMVVFSIGEYICLLFQVVIIVLVVLWIVVVLFIFYFGDKMLLDLFNLQLFKLISLVGCWCVWCVQWVDCYFVFVCWIVLKEYVYDYDLYQCLFYMCFCCFLDVCLCYCWWVIVVIIVLFVFLLMLFCFVLQQFFLDLIWFELMVDIELVEGVLLVVIQVQVIKLEKLLKGCDGIINYVVYVGIGLLCFYLLLDQQLLVINFLQFVVFIVDVKVCEVICDWLIKDVIKQFLDVQMCVICLENGFLVGYLVQMCVLGEYIVQVQVIVWQVEVKVCENLYVINVNLDWSELSKVVWLVIDQDCVCVLGVSSVQVGQFLSSLLLGMWVSMYCEGNCQIEMLLCGLDNECVQLDLLVSLVILISSGMLVMLLQVVCLEYVFEDGIIWYCNCLLMVIVCVDIGDGMQVLDVVQQILLMLDGICVDLFSGYLLEIGGIVEDLVCGQDLIKVGMLLFLIVVVILLMLQLCSFLCVVMVLVIVLLGIIGVILFLLLFCVLFGFVVLFGIIVLVGMIMCNLVILIDQIQQDIDVGYDCWYVIIDVIVCCFCLIVLIVLVVVLVMILLLCSVFYGLMVILIMGGLIVGIVLILVFLLVLYVVWFWVKLDEVKSIGE